MRKLAKDIDSAINKHYPLLNRVEEDGKIVVKGYIVLSHPNYGEFDRYEVLVSFPSGYPKCLPKVIETNQKIPRIADRHVNPDTTLCLAVEQEERMVTKHGISFRYFLDKVLVPHLSRETYRTLNGKYEDGEYAHGYEGIWEYFKAKLNVSKNEDVIYELERIIYLPKPLRNERCYCGLDKKFKNCHFIVCNLVKPLGTEYLKNQLETLKIINQNER